MSDQEERWLTYAEVGQLLGISAEAARAMSRRQKWPRRTPNDHGALARVLVPNDRLPNRPRPAVNGGHPGDGRGTYRVVDQLDDRPDTTPVILRTVRETVELLLEPLQEQLTIANQRADRAERRTEELQAALDAKTRELNALLVHRTTPPAQTRRRWWLWRR
jgi:hypothetical protein